MAFARVNLRLLVALVTVSLFTIMPERRELPVGELVWHLAGHWRAAVDRALRPLGITRAQYVLLASLQTLTRGTTPPSQRQVAEHSRLEVVYVSKLTRSLLAAGLLRREDHPEDTRAFQLRLSAAGLRTVREAGELVRRQHEALLAPIGGRSSRRTAYLARILEALLIHAESRPRPRVQRGSA